MHPAHLAIAAAALTLAGCLAPAEPPPRPSETNAATPPPPPDAGAAAQQPGPPQGGAGLAAPVELHAFEGTVTGAAPPSPLGPGIAAGLPAALEETFEVPAGTLCLWSEIKACGLGEARIEILDPGGATVIDTGRFVIAGAEHGFCPWVGLDDGAEGPPAPAPGGYRVVYQVAGTLDVRLRVAADLQR